MKVIENQTFDMERALYGCNGIAVRNCSFDGPADGESAFKEGEQIEVSDCFFNLRYPFWHDRGLTITDSEMTQGCRAALWSWNAAMSSSGTAISFLRNLAGLCGESVWKTLRR